MLATDKQRLKVVKDKQTAVDAMCEQFEKQVNLTGVKDKLKKTEDVEINNAADLEKMLGEFREAALVINHENRKKKAATGKNDEEEYKDDNYSASKKKADGVPRSLRMVDLESERYQEEKKKKIKSFSDAHEENLDSRSCMRCNIF